ncbi:MAG: class I SAM-dependent methyltransferase [Planctomycetota bacterium]|jgi:SAM-dependent methyltransferase
MQVIEGKRVKYDSDEEFYAHQAKRPHFYDKNRIMRGRIAEALRFFLFGGTLKYTDPLATRPDPDFSPDMRFLDIGCADGWSLTYLNKGCPEGFAVSRPEKRFRNTCGVELIREVAEYARRKRRNVIQGDIRHLVIGESAFDLIYTRHCLEHLDDPLATLKNINQMLTPGGHLLAIVPKEEQDLNMDRSVHSYQFRGDEDLADLVRAAGLTVTQSFRRNSYTYRKRKYWYRLFPPVRQMERELWVLATKPESDPG